MPLGADKLPQETVAQIAEWIATGAPYDGVLGTAKSDTASVADHTDSDSLLFATDIRPLLEKVCLNCHSAEDMASGLDLSTRDGLLRGGERGPALSPGKPQESLLYKAIAHESEPHMPFRAGRLPQSTIDRVAEWIAEGSAYNSQSLTADVSAPPQNDHWAYQPVARPAIPDVSAQDWVLTPVDAFVAAEQEERSLAPLPPADRRTLLRRVYLDLIGIPPTPEQTRAFLNDPSPDAYRTVVDSLLSSPHYGERWGRHWMDIWRYSDWYGFQDIMQVRYSQRHVWRWRDWIVESLNNDKGYDQMIIEMIAGDEVAPAAPDTLRATGYLARSWYKFNRNIWLQDTAEYVAASFLGTTLRCARCHDHKYDPILQTDYYRFRAFFEPHDVRVDRVPGEPDTLKDGLARTFDAEPGTPTYRFIRGNEDMPDETRRLEPRVPRVLGGSKLVIREIELTLDAYYPDLRETVLADLLAQRKSEIEVAEKELAEAEEGLAHAQRDLQEASSETASHPSAAVKTVANEDRSQAVEDAVDGLQKGEVRLELARKALLAAQAGLPALEARIRADKAKHGLTPNADPESLADNAKVLERNARVLRAEEEVLRARQELAKALQSPDSLDKMEGRAETDAVALANEEKVKEAQKRIQAALKFLSGPTDGYTPVGTAYTRTSTGRRLALSRWIADKSNPLTARVAVNHLWGRHFGRPLVETVFNFGLNGKAPTHPELLDWLAAELMDKDWSLKSIHRLIVMSNTYKTQSWAPSSHTNVAKDQDNVYLWRRNPLRMEAELVRDGMLSVAGELDTTLGGPDIDVAQGQKSRRRSLYFSHSPNGQVQLLKLFDAADPVECFERNVSVTPHQALALSNSELSYVAARTLAGNLTNKVGEATESDATLIDLAFEIVLGRPPSPEEKDESLQFVRSQTSLFQRSPQLKRFETGPLAAIEPAASAHMRARESFVHALLGHNEFVTIR